MNNGLNNFKMLKKKLYIQANVLCIVRRMCFESSTTARGGPTARITKVIEIIVLFFKYILTTRGVRCYADSRTVL